MIRLLVADDSDVIRFGLHALIDNEPDIEVVGMAPDGAVAVEIAVADAPDVVLMDLSMPILDGVSATREIRRVAPTVRVLVLTSSSHESIVREVFAAGAQGYVLKEAEPTALLDAIRAVYRGESPMTPVIREMLDA